MEKKFSIASSRKKGTSLAEMCVVLAVISIISLVVVSFTLMVNARSQTATVKLKAMEDARLIQSVVTGWMAAGRAEGAAFDVGGTEMTAVVGEEVYKLWLEEDRLMAEYSSESSASVTLSAVRSITFEKLQNTADEIYFCHMTYTVTNSQGAEKEERLTFSVNPREGDLLTETGG